MPIGAPVDFYAINHFLSLPSDLGIIPFRDDIWRGLCASIPCCGLSSPGSSRGRFNVAWMLRLPAV